jgi:adenine-specific DNA-methyltransferase
LVKDEIDRLFESKALVNWKRYTAKGEEKIKELKRDKDGTIRENLIVKGNNLLALHSLKEQFAGEVNLIYIDPPYNRDEDGFYNDRFKHSTWLTFMKNRLEIANELLSNKGAIFISIDDNEMAYLKALCDEIFVRDNFLAQIAYERSGVSGLGQGGDFLVNTHESILCYKKSGFEVVDNSGESPFTYEDMKRYNKIFLSAGKRKEVKRFIAPSTKKPVIIYKHEGESINTISLKNFKERQKEIEKEYKNNFSKVFRNTSIQEENQFQNKILSLCGRGLYSADYTVSRGKKKGEKITAYYLNQQVFAWLCETAKLEDNTIIKTNKLSDFWDHASIPKADLANEGGVKLRRGKKPENLLKKLIELATNKGDLVLDFFVGSGTTCAVAHKIGRRYMGVEQLDYGDNDCLKRIKNVIAGDKTGISKKVNWEGGGDFVYVEFAKWNEEAKEKILKAKSLDELEILFDELYERYFLNYNVKTKEFKEKTIKEEGFKKLSLDEQKKLFVEMLDMNQMYVNFSERNDKKYNLSKEDIALSEEFYGCRK